MDIPKSMTDMFDKIWDKIDNDADVQRNMLLDLLKNRGYDYQATAKFCQLFMKCTDKAQQDQLFVDWNFGRIEKSLFRRKLILNQSGMFMRQLILVYLSESIGRPPPKFRAGLGLIKG